MSNNARRMLNLFRGFMGAYGTYNATDRRPGSGKLEIKKSAQTIREPITEELWDKHLNGEQSLGIIPINEDNMCWWGCIDIDRYDVNHTEIVTTLERRGLPFIVCKSKSDGAHVFIFLKEAQPAGELQALLRDVAASLGYGDCEVFPKQAQVLLDRGDMGNWLNMPYFGETRRAVKKTGAEMTVEEFILAAQSAAVMANQFKGVGKSANKAKKEGPDKADFEDGPPCLQHLSDTGYPEGTRNKGLFNAGLYFKKKYGDKWFDKLEAYNRERVIPPLPAEEVMGIRRSLEKKDYQYACKDTPLSLHCNSALCRTRKYGISSSGKYPVISGLSVLNTDPPLFFLDIEDTRIELDTDTLQNYKLFHKKCMAVMFTCFMMIKQDTWNQMVGAAMEQITLIEAPPEVGRQGQFTELLQDFCLNRQRGERKDDILSGRPWEDPELGRHFFRLRDVQKFLEREGVRDMTRGQITQRIRALGGGTDFQNIKGHGVNLWWVPSSFGQPTPHVEPPAMKENVI